MFKWAFKRGTVAGLALAAGLVGCSGRGSSSPRTADASPTVCRLPPPSATIPVASPRPGELQLMFDLTDSPVWWAEAPPDPEIAAFRAAVSKEAGGSVAWRDLAERSHRILAAGDDAMKRDAANVEQVLAGALGTPAPASCLETLLFLEQAHRYPMLAHPTEMHAFVLRGPRGVRVYWSGSDFVGGKVREEVTSRIDADLASGYVLAIHVHNHNFLFHRVIGDRMWTTELTKDDIGGAVVPSQADIGLYRGFHESSGLRAAWVTNGFDSMHYDAADFSRFVTAETR